MNRMRIVIGALAVASIAVWAPTPARSDDVSYPKSEPGRHAREFFDACNKDEAAMRAFYTSNVSSKDLEERPADARLGVWRRMRGEQGTLNAVRVLAEGADFVEVLVHVEHGQPLKIRFNCSEEPPHTLLNLRLEPADEMGGGPPPAPEASGPPPDDSHIVASLSSDLERKAAAGEFSGAALLDKRGKSLLESAYGLASRKENRANAVGTRFNLGSINKIFTHVAILQLEQQGKLKLDDTIDRFLPDYPKANGSRVTVRILLDHRGGVPDVLESRKLWDDPLRVRTVSDWYALVRDRDLEFEPGTRQKYSNGGYVLLGAIVERVSGEDYYAYVKAHVYDPAGMTDAESDLGEALPGKTAVGYVRELHAGGVELVEEKTRLGRGSPAGGGYATVRDLVAFANALRAGKLLDSAHTSAMIGDQASLGIAGGSPGVNALLEMSGPYTLVVLSNLDPPAAEQFGQTAGRMIRRAAGGG